MIEENVLIQIPVWITFQKQPSRGVLIKRCSENMQQIYRRTSMPKCDFNKVAKQHLFSRTPLKGCFCMVLLKVQRVECEYNKMFQTHHSPSLCYVFRIFVTQLYKQRLFFKWASVLLNFFVNWTSNVG